MKILMLTPYLPYPLYSGGQIRTYNLLKQLADKHEITLFALIKDSQEEQYIKQIQPFCHQVRVFRRSKNPFTCRNIIKTGLSSYPFLVIRNHVPEAVTAIMQELQTHRYDLIHAETFYMMPHIPKTTVPVLLVEQTIEYLGYQSYASKHRPPLRWLLDIDIQKIIKWEQHYWSQADLLVTMSENDKKYIQAFLKNPQKVHVVSNGVDTSWFQEKPKQPRLNPTVLYVGTFKWLPNIEAAIHLMKNVWPIIHERLPSAQLHIVGNAPTSQIMQMAKSYHSIKVLGRVEDIRDAFANSHLLLAPVFSGKGTRYKILEALASHTPVVASSTAVEGLNLIHNQHALISDDPNKMAEYSIKLLSSSTLRELLSANGYRFINQNYDWQIISKKLDNIYQSMG